MKKFYQHLIEVQSLTVELDELDLTQEQKTHLSSLVDSSLHHTVLDAILSELSESDKHVFINHLKTQDHEKIWGFLNSKVDKIEDKIKKAADDLKEQLRKDLKEAKRAK